MISNNITTKPSNSVNKALEKAIKEIEALNTEQARMARHNELMIARSEEMNASPRGCLLYTSPSPRDVEESRMPSSA